jgi:hypothetical protein
LFQPWKDCPLVDFHRPQSDVKCLWNKGPAIWFPKVGLGTAATLMRCGGQADAYRDAARLSRCAQRIDLYDARHYPREGGREVECKKAE